MIVRAIVAVAIVAGALAARPGQQGTAATAGSETEIRVIPPVISALPSTPSTDPWLGRVVLSPLPPGTPVFDGEQAAPMQVLQQQISVTIVRG